MEHLLEKLVQQVKMTVDHALQEHFALMVQMNQFYACQVFQYNLRSEIPLCVLADMSLLKTKSMITI